MITIFTRNSLITTTNGHIQWTNMTSRSSALAANVDCCLAKDSSSQQCIAAEIS